MHRTLARSATTLAAIAAAGLVVGMPAQAAPSGPQALEGTLSTSDDGSWTASVDGPFTPFEMEGTHDGLVTFAVESWDSYPGGLKGDDKPSVLAVQADDWDLVDASTENEILINDCPQTNELAPSPVELDNTSDSYVVNEDGEREERTSQRVADDAKVVAISTFSCQPMTAPRENGDFLASTTFYLRTEAGGEFQRIASRAMEGNGHEGSFFVWDTAEGWEWLEQWTMGDPVTVPADKQWVVNDTWPTTDGPIVDTGRVAEAGTPWAALLAGGGLLGLGGLVTARGIARRA